MDANLAKSFWYSPEVGFSYSNLLGRSGGLLILWNDKVEVVNSFKGEGYLGIKACWENKCYYVINVYSPCLLIKKIALWKKLLELKETFKDGEWIMGGNFNVIKNTRERKGQGVYVHKRDMDLFSEFIDRSALVNIPCKGKKFSWFSGDGKSMSKIHHFIVSNDVVTRWEIMGQFIGDRDISDHCPIWILKDQRNRGPKPFKFNNEWFSFDSFIPFVEKEWKSLKVEGRGDFVLKEKLRLLKDKLRIWNKDVFGRIDLEMEDGASKMNLADDKLASDDYFNFDSTMEFRKEASKDFFNFFNYFFGGSSLSKAITSSFFTLIPKKHNPLGLDDSRPICLVGCIYKVAAKLLAGRLKKVLNSIISSCQTAFVPGRQLLDGVIVANEVVDYARKAGSNCTLFKVDFEKAYDKVSWTFLHFMFKAMGFGRRWIKWMELLVFKSDMSVLVNGSSSKEFGVYRGLRQGDPISPFLFVLVAEALTALVRKSIELGDFESFVLEGKCRVDILQFAEDTLLVGDGSWKHIRSIKAVLRAFELVSGLGINYHKTASHFLSCKIEEIKFIFLGIPIGHNPRLESTWDPLLNKTKARLEGWTNRFLNLGGMITLLKSVLSSLSIFTMSFYKMPLKVVKKFNSLQSKFLWGGLEEKRKIHWVRWKDLSLHIEKGGLRVKDIALFNISLLNKWRWRILQGRSSLWLDVLKARASSSFSSIWWRDLVKISSSFHVDPMVEKVKFNIHNGFHTPFWETSWLEGIPLKEEFPDLYLNSNLKGVSLAGMGGGKKVLGVGVILV
ncbi:uncharacterized protein LOC131650829 [Vicia villosa]|uniref:uncharacterized protein LOC131650829 n=1 Tax=Vicia villosa TaxID=3911 RepID=UPI00273BA89A|nr:uncharacterized protein LOC131650829 [Vicia villosa]